MNDHDRAKDLIRSAGEFIWLQGIGLSWAASPFSLVLLRHDPSLRAGEAVLPVLAALDSSLLVATPVAAVGGLGLVPYLLGWKPPSSRLNAVVAVALVTSGVWILLLWHFLTLSFDLRQVVGSGLSILCLLGGATTVVAIGGRSRLGAALWAFLFIATPVYLRLNAVRVVGLDPDWAFSLRVDAAALAALLVTWVVAVALLVGARQYRRSDSLSGSRAE